MRNDLSDITLVVDRSGSMAACREEAQGGINAFIHEQQKQPGDALLTLVQFDTTYDFIHNGKPIKEVPVYTLEPRGMTALLDAVGRAIAETGSRLEKTPEADRPGCVVFVIVTDGQENSSHEFTRVRIKEMIEHQRTTYQWKFTFLGADDSAFAEAASIGIAAGQTAKYDPAKFGKTYNAVACSVSNLRGQAARGFTGGDVQYSDEQRRKMV